MAYLRIFSCLILGAFMLTSTAAAQKGRRAPRGSGSRSGGVRTVEPKGRVTGAFENTAKTRPSGGGGGKPPRQPPAAAAGGNPPQGPRKLTPIFNKAASRKRPLKKGELTAEFNRVARKPSKKSGPHATLDLRPPTRPTPPRPHGPRGPGF